MYREMDLLEKSLWRILEVNMMVMIVKMKVVMIRNRIFPI